mgnify:CR=1 FL=1
MSTLIDQAWALHKRLDRTAYQILCAYSRIPYYDRRIETDPRIERLNRLLGRSDQRILRRINRSRRARTAALLERTGQ